MISSALMQVGFYLVILILLTPMLGSYMSKVFSSQKTWLTPAVSPVENFVYRICLINPHQEMTWKQYAGGVGIVSIFGIFWAFLLQIAQSQLMLNPQGHSNVPWASALNTAVSFVTNTNWQAYSGEATLSYLTQMLALTVQNFLSAAVGIAVAVALIRSLTRKNTHSIGNFWTDLTRINLYILLPISFVFAVLLAGQGVVQNFSPYLEAKTMEGIKQIIPMGPAASQIAIKQLGTNGGGFFGVNSAHPFENPTPFSNFLQMLAILLISSSLIYSFGIMTKARKHAFLLYGVTLAIFLCSLGVSLWSELQPNAAQEVAVHWEGKELRFGVGNSVLWSTATTAASNGSVNAMQDSLSPLSGGVALFLMLLGEIIFGGVGSGLYGMLLFVFLTVFLAGLMIGRTPEYMGKKIEGWEIKMALIGILAPSAVVLIGAGISSVLPISLSSLTNAGPHGLSEILYAWGSAANNNGSSFGGLNANTNYYNLLLSVAMLVGRFGVLFPVLAIAGSFANKKITPSSEATFSTEGVTFAILLTSVILIIGALTFLPSLALGPIVEHFLMNLGRTF